MATKSPTPILLDTKILNRLIGDVLDFAGVPASQKSACLNKAAARIAGPKQNWGFLTNHGTPVVAQGVSGYDIVETSEQAPQQKDDSTVSIGLFPAALRVGLCTHKKIMLISGPPSVGLSTPIIEAAEEINAPHYSIRTSLLLQDEMVCWDDKSRLQKNLRPGKEGFTLYEDVDGLSDDGLRALENEIILLAQAQPDAQIILITNFRDQLIPRLRDIAPRLFERALQINVEAPMPKALKDFLSAPVKMAPAEDHLPSFPTLESWDKAGEIMQSAQSGLNALREATNIVNVPGGLRDYAVAPPRIEAGGFSHLLSFMESLPKLSPRVTTFMRKNSDEVDFGMLREDVMPKAWQDIARLVKLYDEACESGTKARQDQHAYLVRHYANGHLRKNAADLLRHLGL